MISQEDALEAAKLAKSIGSQLQSIDKLTVERPDRPANQIDINKFISQVVDPRRQVSTNSSGYVPEEFVQSLVPEPQYAFEQPVFDKNGSSPKQPIVDINSKQFLKPESKKQQASIPNNLVVEDKTMKKLVNAIERIAKSYEKYVDCYVISNKINDQNNIINE
jgi:hypothetical protein